MNKRKNKNEDAWERIFSEYDALKVIEREGSFCISAEAIKAYREPRLMAKFDHWNALPKIFKDNHLSILPISRGDYIVSSVNNYHQFEPEPSDPIRQLSLTENLQSLDVRHITSESMALNAAMASGIMADFLADPLLLPTVSGRMGSGCFRFTAIKHDGTTLHIAVDSAQIEIDAAHEGKNGLAIFEAKNHVADDFLIRQLYYPFRTWQAKLKKRVRPVFLTYSNGVYTLREYRFEKPCHYNSIKLHQQARYAIEDTAIDLCAIQGVLQKSRIKPEPPDIPFPQADSFPRIINLCEIMQTREQEDEAELDKDAITQEYDFDARQTDYYTNAGRYLGLVEKAGGAYRLSDNGRKILALPYRQRQLQYCNCLFSHRIFNELMQRFFQYGRLPALETIIQTMQFAQIVQLDIAPATLRRRAQTVYSWLNWVASLVQSKINLA